MRTAWFSSKYNICRKYCIDEINNIEGANKNRIYEEEDNNIAKYYVKISIYPLKIASIFAILFSFFTFFRLYCLLYLCQYMVVWNCLYSH